LIGTGERAKRAIELEIEYTQQIQSTKGDKFYFINYLHPHAICQWNRGNNENLFKILEGWDFNEDAIFWFFSDHGPWTHLGMQPKPLHFYTWAIIKGFDIQQPVISIKDFALMIREKSIPSYIDRMFLTEDARERFGKMKMTTAIACQITKDMECQYTSYHDGIFSTTEYPKQIQALKDGFEWVNNE